MTLESVHYTDLTASLPISAAPARVETAQNCLETGVYWIRLSLVVGISTLKLNMCDN